MTTLAVSEVVNRAARMLYDKTKVRWSEQELVDYCNDAELQTVQHRPDLAAHNTNVQLVAGTRQTIPADGIRFLKAIRNRGSAGATNGNAIRQAYMEALDSEVPDWHSRTTNSEVQHYVIDNADPKHFYVYPGLANGATLFLEVLYARTPPAITSISDNFTLGRENLNALLDFVLYRAFSKDAEYAGNAQRAAMHAQAYAMALGIEMDIQWAVTGMRGKPAGQPPDEAQLSPRRGGG